MSGATVFATILVVAWLLPVTCQAAPTVSRPHSPYNFTMDVYLPAHGSAETNAVWFAYLGARTTYIGSRIALYPERSVRIVPRYQEELIGRNQATSVYAELRHDNPSFHMPYFDDLMRVQSANFMPEYVWTYLRETTWTSPPATLRLREFEAWSEPNLPQHKVESGGWIQVLPKETGATPTDDELTALALCRSLKGYQAANARFELADALMSTAFGRPRGLRVNLYAKPPSAGLIDSATWQCQTDSSGLRATHDWNDLGSIPFFMIPSMPPEQRREDSGGPDARG